MLQEVQWGLRRLAKGRVGSRCFKNFQQGMKGARRFLRFYKIIEGSGRFKEVQGGS